MLKNYLKIAIRNLIRNKLYTAVSMFGLALGLAVSLLVLQYLFYEFSFDRIYKDTDRIYQVYITSNFSGNTSNSSWTPPYLSEDLQKNFPQIESSTSFNIWPYDVFKDNKLFKDYNICFADSAFFNIFNFKFVQGNPNKYLIDMNSIIITEKFAKEYFGTTGAVGKTIDIHIGKGTQNFNVTGIIKDIPSNSSMQFNGIISKQHISYYKRLSTLDWNYGAVKTFIKIKSSPEIAQLSKMLPEFVRSTGENPANKQLQLLKLKDVHFRTDISNNFSPTDIKYDYILSSAGLLVLIISLLNFIGINMTLYSKRIREIGIRKAVGAKKIDLILQFITENILVILTSLIIAFCFVEIIFPLFNSIMDVKINLEFSQISLVAISLIIVVSITSLLTGIYITNFFSSLKPGFLIRGQLKDFNLKKNFRKAPVAVQFILAIFLICCTLILIEQLNFIKNKDLGFNKDQFLIINAGSLGNNWQAFENELKSYSNIKYVTGADWFPGKEIGGYSEYSEHAFNGKPVKIYQAYVDENFIPALEFKLLKGRNFNSLIDTNNSRSVIVNEETLKEFNIKNPLTNGFYLGSDKWEIIGVLEDYNYQSLKQNINTVVFQYNKGNPYKIGVKIKKGKIKETLSYINNVWNKINPNSELDYSFLDDDINKLYLNENRMFKAVTSASVISILIALMGIFALSSFLIESMTKEIAIRKVLGSSVPGIVNLLSSSFVKIILLANLIALPAAYYFMNKWLQEFVYRININFLIFFLAGMSVLVIAFLTISYHTVKAATANPVKSLRYE